MKSLLSQINHLKPIIRIGKNGLTESSINDIKFHLKKRKIIKVRLLKSFINDKDKKELAKEMALKTGSDLIKQVGFVVTLIEKEEKNG